MKYRFGSRPVASARWLIATLVALFTMNAGAITIEIDPGTPGDVATSYYDITTLLTDAGFTTTPASSVDLDIVFSDMKYLKDAQYLYISLRLDFDDIATSPFPSGIPATYLYLSDIDGDEIMGQSVGLLVSGGDTVTYNDSVSNGPKAFGNDADPNVPTFYDIHWSLTLPNGISSLDFAGLEIFADGSEPIVGKGTSTVPEPLTLILLGTGLLGLRLGTRRRQG